MLFRRHRLWSEVCVFARVRALVLRPRQAGAAFIKVPDEATKNKNFEGEKKNEDDVSGGRKPTTNSVCAGVPPAGTSERCTGLDDGRTQHYVLEK